MVRNLHVTWKVGGSSVTSWVTVTFPRRALLRAVIYNVTSRESSLCFEIMSCKIRVRFSAGASICPFDVASRAHWTHPVFYTIGAGALSPRVKTPDCEVYHSCLSHVEVDDAWSYKLPPLPLCSGVYDFKWCTVIYPIQWISLEMKTFLIDIILLNNLKISLFVGRVIGGCCWSSYVILVRRTEWRMAISLWSVFLFVDSYGRLLSGYFQVYEPEGRDFDTRWGHWIFQLT
jgi:hypothetical protein